jgi:uncharacterized membrane protein
MKAVRDGILLFIGAVAVSLTQAWYFYPLLPERVASHFGPDGRADGWTAKDAFIGVSVGTILFLSVFMSALSALIARIPDEAINLPNKEYWLAPERRAASLAAVQDRMSVMNTATVAFLLYVFQCAYEANLKPDPRLDGPFWLVPAVYFVFVGVWSFGFYGRFRLPRQ